MTTFTSVFKATANRKKGPLALILLTDLGLVAAFWLFFLFSPSNAGTVGLGMLMSGFSFLTLIAQFYLFSRELEIWKQNRYRLLPLTTGRMMLANYASTLILDLIYFAALLVITVLVLVLFGKAANMTFGAFSGMFSLELTSAIVPEFVVPVLAYLAGWFGLTTAFLLVNMMMRRMGQKSGLSNLLIFIVIYAFASIIIGGLNLLRPWLTTAVWLVVLPLLMITFFFLNRWLLERFIETGK